MKPRKARASAAILSLLTVLVAVRADTVTHAAGVRLSSPEDRYALAGGCYTVGTNDGYITRTADGFGTTTNAAKAEPFHFQATDLGSYLLYGTARDFLAASEGAAAATVYSATRSTAGSLAGAATSGATDIAADAVAHSAANDASGRGASITSAKTATELTDFVIDQADPDSFTVALPAVGKNLISDAGKLSLATAPNTDPRAHFSFSLADGCAGFPEVEVNVKGEPAKGASPISEVRGYFDAHVHAMAYEFLGGRVRCGRPWSRFGVDQALVDCPDHGPHGQTAALEMVLSGGDPVTGHSPEGWPTFDGWPRPESLTHEQVYYKWLERAWRGGLRMMTNLLVDNHALCFAYPLKQNSCNEMDGVRLQAKRIREFERYIDAQSGGPGEGWFRIVTDPFQARDVMNQGKLAVVLGIEVSSPLDCNVKQDIPQCDPAQIDRGLDEAYALGVRQMELANKFDNALTGVTGDSGTTGVVVNTGNLTETGSFWAMGTCAKNAGPVHDEPQLNAHDQGAPDQLTGRDSIFAGVLDVSGKSGAAPVYGQGPHCNKRGLTALGEYAVKGLIKRGMIFDPDHMSALARQQALDIVQAAGYSGVVSSHSWADDLVYKRVYDLGGVVTPHAGSSTGFKKAWEQLRTEADPRFKFGFGYGSDVNGFSKQGAPRRPSAANAVTYPFTGLGGVIVNKQVSGTRTYDINTDGVSHYGLYPDWIEDLRKIAGQAIVDDMQRGPEAYVQMWERASGIAPDACRADIADLTPANVATVTTGMTGRQVLDTIGQPHTRNASSFTYCVGAQTATVSFGLDSTVTSVTVS